MAPVTEGKRTAEFLVSEANGHRSREEVTVTVAANTTVPAGRIMGRITATGKYVPQVAAGTDNGTREPAAILYANVTNDTGDAADFTATIVARDAEVEGAALTYDPAANAGAIATANADLAAFGLIVR